MLHKILLVDLTELDGINAAEDDAVTLRTKIRNLTLEAKYRKNVSPAPMVNVPVEFLIKVNNATLKTWQILEQQDFGFSRSMRAACNILIIRPGKMLKLRKIL